VPFYFINLLPTSLLYISILLSPHANRFIIGTTVINTQTTHINEKFTEIMELNYEAENQATRVKVIEANIKDNHKENFIVVK
jgi:hypothetical protein